MVLKLSKKTMFAVEAVLDIAYHTSFDPVQSKDIANRHNIPRRYLEQVLQKLVRNRVLKGTRGPKGGYHLARERRKITLDEIVQVVDELEGRENLYNLENGSDLSKKILKPLWQEMARENMEKLASVSLQDLCDVAREKGVHASAPKNLDYVI